MQADGIGGCGRAPSAWPRLTPRWESRGRRRPGTSHIWKVGFNILLRGAGRGSLAHFQGSSPTLLTPQPGQGSEASAGAPEILDPLRLRASSLPPLWKQIPPSSLRPAFSGDRTMAFLMRWGLLRTQSHTPGNVHAG